MGWLINTKITMEIKLSVGDKINIPTGCKATIEDDLIVIEEKKEESKEFKDGDILRSLNSDRIVIFSKYSPNDKGMFDCYFSSTEDYTTGWFTDGFRHATEEEKQLLFDMIKKKGLRWNAKTKELERIRKRAEWGEIYYYLYNNGKICETIEVGLPLDDDNYNIGNYYLPEEREQAEEDAKAVRAIYAKRLKVK